MSRVALLDVNVLVALFDPDHVHHEVAHDWFADRGRAGWATCPMTEAGFLRVLSNPAYRGTVPSVADLAARLRRFCRSGRHVFWGDELSLIDEAVVDLPRAGGHRQLTDLYLLALAHAKGGCLATFDRTIPLRAVKGATADSLEVIAPAE
jgi:toxin-antitoxin system PIN domain toxin